ncbi:MAG: hypothetical protein LC657_15125, partial [Desulfobacteraceae bacterium]|nr:hypothetical protein [Desulfobacteraceae bacterium]
MQNGDNDFGDDATIDIATLSGTQPSAPAQFDFNNSTVAEYDPDTSYADKLIFSVNQAPDQEITITETSSATVGDIKSAVITGTVTMVTDPGMSIRSSFAGTGSGGVFDSNQAKKGSSILTLGGEGGFSGITSGGETISFTLDGANVSFITTAGSGPTDLQIATRLEAGLLADLDLDDYQIIRTGSSVSIIKAAGLEDPITIKNFSDTGGSDAQIAVRTGTGTGTNQPENDTLSADPAKSHLSSTTSTLYDDEGVILWERLDKDGLRSGASGLLSVEDEGRVEIMEKGVPTLSFDISAGSLVAGNTLTLNTNESGAPDPLDFRITGRANSINDLYQFKVVSGGKVGHLPKEGEESLEIFWSNSVTNGTFTIEGHDPPYTPETPVEVLVDGMNFKFSDGTLFTDDVFTVTTGDTGIPLSNTTQGNPSGETLSDWHWTLDSFAGQFNRVGQGMKASTTLD